MENTLLGRIIRAKSDKQPVSQYQMFSFTFQLTQIIFYFLAQYPISNQSCITKLIDELSIIILVLKKIFRFPSLELNIQQCLEKQLLSLLKKIKHQCQYQRQNKVYFSLKQKKISFALTLLNNTYIQEKIPVKVFNNQKGASIWIAAEIAQIIKQKQNQGLPCVLGLATGSTPIQVYKELVRLHKEDGLSFNNVITFNLDEYFPIPKESLHSYWHFMHENLFKHVDIKKENIHIPDGTLIKEQVEDFCQYYENLILEKGGLDFQLLGIGSTGKQFNTCIYKFIETIKIF